MGSLAECPACHGRRGWCEGGRWGDCARCDGKGVVILSTYTLFQGRYGGGCGSDECPKDNDDTTRVCLARGTVPCDVLFIGEAPGESENVLGKPFSGPAGHLLDHVIKRAIPEGVTYCLTNLVCCIPRDKEGPNAAGKASEPLPEQIRQCSQRLIDFVAVCRPKVIVTVGRLARDWLDPKCHPRHRVDVDPSIPRADMIHPAAILRMNMAQRGLAVQRCVVAVTGAVREYVLGGAGKDPGGTCDAPKGDRVVLFHDKPVTIAQVLTMLWHLLHNEDVLYPVAGSTAEPLDCGVWEGTGIRVTRGNKEARGPSDNNSGRKMLLSVMDKVLSATGPEEYADVLNGVLNELGTPARGDMKFVRE